MLSRALSKIYQIYRLKILKKGLSAGIAAGRSRRITNDIIPSAGAGFLVAISGDIMRMPGLPKRPAAVNMDIDEDGKIIGLF